MAATIDRPSPEPWSDPVRSAPSRRNGWASWATWPASRTSPPVSTTRRARCPSAPVVTLIQPPSLLCPIALSSTLSTIRHSSAWLPVTQVPSWPVAWCTVRCLAAIGAGPHRQGRGGEVFQRERGLAGQLAVLRPGERQEPVEQPVHPVEFAAQPVRQGDRLRRAPAPAWPPRHRRWPASWPAGCAVRARRWRRTAAAPRRRPPAAQAARRWCPRDPSARPWDRPRPAARAGCPRRSAGWPRSSAAAGAAPGRRRSSPPPATPRS